jgi:intracellular sulfur oxidation DsrE/DsrF family protein
MNTELRNSIEDFLQNLETEVDVLNYVDIDNIDFNNAFESIRNMVEDNNGFDDINVIYFSNAIDYLSKNDPSLQESLGIAAEYGYETHNLNSEILASLLKRENVRNEFYQLENEINDFFEELEEGKKQGCRKQE